MSIRVSVGSRVSNLRREMLNAVPRQGKGSYENVSAPVARPSVRERLWRELEERLRLGKRERAWEIVQELLGLGA